MAAAEAYQGLARKYRPQTFEDLIGQEGVAHSLSQALRQNKVVHGHLLSGPRGTGKTTTARILARALNCVQGPTPTPCGVCRHCIDIANGSDMDVIEIDGASNNGVDNIRELRERVGLAPFAARFKVYIIDEVHMLSPGAFNALLKTVEEPPDGVIFILATTEMEKVPETIRSRCAPHQFRRLTTDDLVRRLSQVAEREGIKLSPEAAREVFGPIARTVDGGMRDALVMLDQLLALTDGKPTAEAAVQLLGLADSGMLADAVDWLAAGKGAELLGLIEQLAERGRSLERFVKELVAYLRDLMLLRAGVGEELTSLMGERLARARAQAEAISPAAIYNILNQMFALEERLKLSTQSRFLIEFTFLRLAEIRPVVPLDEIMNRMRAIPDSTFGGGGSGGAGIPAKAETQAPRAIERKPEPARRQAEPAMEPALRETSASSSYASHPGMSAAVMNERVAAPAAESADSSSAGRTPDAFADRTSDEILQLLRSQLPDTIEGIFARYIGQIVDARAEGAALRLTWSGSNSLGRRMIEKPENSRALEAALSQIAGQPMKIVHADGPAGVAQTPVAMKAPPPSAANKAQPAMADSGFDGGDTGDDADGEGQGMALRMASENALPAPGPEENAHSEKRSPLERAQAFLNLNEEAPRRLKMLRDMFQGRVIDDEGRPLAM